mmetsp:Transcript_32065/g.65453  ORF Transcript_32065/g.65453 Transcript_32065/m.65453 type:complete len:145 (-) Transcript_32065:284-718(-)|eukprot:CAMPEP_0183290560 /NCGR_PEP_ID=MMETSP0160_2-20130417/190_1 /TAXON_ID=2839 ORGANISM="Odontella Sinensis, Strain Grunow 1884" /NCGR_SAMPLE_ID=MMETSP0160_2 /ASSEMBLY_ACC=CAM_ASM_000250 /LENGTH=144 /DNA_ID=CAMNT_0025451185 /DNA_START=83 /DNA_END=517 /DNA_ORIENTATION=+
MRVLSPLLCLFLPVLAAAFVPSGSPFVAPIASSPVSLTSLSLFKDKNYENIINNIMAQKNLSRSEAIKEYDAYKSNPNNYALQKGEEYYRSLGYKSLMEGVIGEAEKEGRGDEVRERVAAFKKKSQLKAAGVLLVAITAFVLSK